MQDQANAIFLAEPSNFDSTFLMTGTLLSKNTTQNLSQPLREINSGAALGVRHPIPLNLDAVFIEQAANNGDQPFRARLDRIKGVKDGDQVKEAQEEEEETDTNQLKYTEFESRFQF